MKAILTVFVLNVCLLATAFSQIDPDYKLADWYGFKTAAVSYTFDDLTSNQLPVAMPIFDQHGYKMTFNVVINWSGNSWNALQAASQKGHEIASHTVSHSSLDGLSDSEQTTQMSSSKATIESRTGSKCVTIAYPNCNVPNTTIADDYYIAGRTCSGQIVSKSPNDFFRISSIICGDQSSNTTAQSLNSKAGSAASSNGWCVFLFHGIDNDGGYSSFSSNELSSHLQYMDQNASTYWIGTFAEVAKYIKERDNASISETEVTADSISVAITAGLEADIYDQPLSVRRLLPSAWEGANVYAGQTKITSEIITENGTDYIQFEAVPGTAVSIANSASKKEPILIPLKKGWNMIGYPYTGSKTIEDVFASVWDQVEIVKDFDQVYAKNNSTDQNTLDELSWGKGYYIYLSQDCVLEW